MTLYGTRESVSHVVASLTSVRCETHFMTIWNDVSRRDENLKIPQPEMRQRRNLPKRFTTVARHISTQMSRHITELKPGMLFWTLSPDILKKEDPPRSC